MQKLILNTPSKINLLLKVTGRRPDGYHELNTLFVPLTTPADAITLEFSPDSGVSVDCSDESVPGGNDNICAKAANAYAEKTGILPCWKIHIDKHIPVAAGMGGGSSDAAAVLNLLNNHYRKLSPAELAKLAVSIGADVPFFLNPHPAVATGIGEIFDYPLEHIPELPLLIINPGFPVSAAWAYCNLDQQLIGQDNSERLPEMLSALRSGNIAQVGKLLHNDLAPALYRKFPLLQLIRDFLLKNGVAGTEITGSGPTIFALCHNLEQRKTMADKLKQTFSQVSVIETHI